jgi:CubicO group peptidase (beta-lactamase class C family)
VIGRHQFQSARDVIDAGLHARAFPAAAIDVGTRTGSLWTEAFGHLTYDTDAPRATTDTIFDLASLTKVIATASIAMRQIGSGRLALDRLVAAILPAWRGDDRAAVTVRHLLDHSSGLPAHARLWEREAGRRAYLDAMAALPLERAPGEASVYSDPGFMLLGFAIEAIGDAPLDDQFRPIASEIADAIRPKAHGPRPGAIEMEALLTYRPSPALADRIAPTEDDPWRGRVLRGEVHDENAAALGGVAAHAGLFGTADAVGAFARLVLTTFHEATILGTPSLMRTFATPTGVPDSSRALGWDTMRPTSSCGTLLSPRAIGHTGFTGTSLWIDPEQDLYVAFLTNRVHPTRAHNAMVEIRPRLHDAVAAALVPQKRRPT